MLPCKFLEFFVFQSYQSRTLMQYNGNPAIFFRHAQVREGVDVPRDQGKKRVRIVEVVVRQLLESLRVAGLVEAVAEPRQADDSPGYQVPALPGRRLELFGARLGP